MIGDGLWWGFRSLLTPQFPDWTRGLRISYSVGTRAPFLDANSRCANATFHLYLKQGLEMTLVLRDIHRRTARRKTNDTFYIQYNKSGSIFYMLLLVVQKTKLSKAKF